MTVQLTKMAKRAGCAAKHPPGYLFPLLSGFPAITDPNVLVGSNTADDAAVYRISADTALVLTTDFFTPIVDDPYDFGAVAAANAISDIYAMGGRPLTALNIVGFPDNTLEPSVLVEILRGGYDKARDAGIDLVGGHTIKTDEPIYGLAVTGTIHPDRIISNAGAQIGDVLVLSKPIGIGIITTAAKQELDSQAAIREAINLMTHLNRGACEAMCQVGVHAATDITGFGLLGHLRNIVKASGCQAEISLAKVPVIPAAWDYVKAGIAPGGTHANWRFLNDWVDYAEGIEKTAQLVLCDAQTSGGLLMAVAPDKASELIEALQQYGTPCAAIVGQIVAGEAGHIQIIV